MRYRKIPVAIDATQWFANGDHPEDDCKVIDREGPKPMLTEGKVVRYYRRPDDSGDRNCEKCGNIMHLHGWIDTLEGGHIVCPGDWIITDVAGERYPCKPDIFEKTFQRV